MLAHTLFMCLMCWCVCVCVCRMQRSQSCLKITTEGLQSPLAPHADPVEPLSAEEQLFTVLNDGQMLKGVKSPTPRSHPRSR